MGVGRAAGVFFLEDMVVNLDSAAASLSVSSSIAEAAGSEYEEERSRR